MVNILAIFIPILFVSGLFVCIALNIYYKYKTKTVMSERVPLESLGEWYKSEAQAKALRSRSAAMRWGSFLGGGGLGLAIGCVIRTAMIYKTPAQDNDFLVEPYYILMIIALTIFCGGLGMIGAYFLERRLDKKSPK